MDIKQELKQVITEMMTGDLKRAIIFIGSVNNEQMKASNKIPINILISLSQVISIPKLRDKISNSDIIKLIKSCCSIILNPTESEMSNYYRSLYHIIKYLSAKVSLKDINILCKFIFPKWVSSEENSKDIYELLVHFNILINNDIIIPNLSTKDEESLISCFEQHLQLLRYIFNRKPLLLFQKLRVYVNMFQKNINVPKFKEFCMFIFDLIEDLNNIEDLEVCREAFNALCSVIMVWYDPSNFEKNRIYIEQTFEKMEILCTEHNEINLCIEIFKNFYLKCVRNIEDYQKNDIKEISNLREICELVLKKFGVSVVVLKTFSYVSEILRTLVKYFDKINKDPWINYMTIEIQSELIKLFSIISKVIRNDKYIDKCNTNCTVSYNLTHSFTISSLSATFFNLSLRYDCQNIEVLNDVAVSSIKDCCKLISQLKQNSCNRWISNWRLLGTLIYNISTKFYRNQNYKLAKFYLKLLCTQIVYLEGEKDANLIIVNALGTCLNLIAHCYNYEQQYRSALTFLSFALHISPEMQEKLWLTWMNVKAKANNNDVGNIFELTIKDILENDIDLIRQLYPNFSYNEKDLEKLLILELKSYCNMWPSKIPMNNSSKQFLNISEDIYLRTVVLNLSWERVISLQDEEYFGYVEKTISLINKNDKGKSSLSKLCLSVLYFIDYQFKSLEILKKNLQEMNEAVKEEKPILKPFEEPTNPHDKCDINPTYYNNNIENNITLYKIINKSIDFWTEILQPEKIDEIKDNLTELNISNIIKNAAFELRIQNYRTQMLKVWKLYYILGEILNDNEILLTSIGFILESIDCNSEIAQNYQKQAEKYMNKNISDENFVTYFINASTGYLRSHLVIDGLKLITKAENKLNKLKDYPKILEARILYLKSLYLHKSCDMKLLDHEENYIVLAHKAFGIIAEFYKRGGSNSLYPLSVLFDISLTIGKLYKSLRMPRETRCYTTESVLLAQQMVLPIRTVQYLSLLAFTDLLGFHFEDSRVKINGIDFIFGKKNSNVRKNSEPINEKIFEVSKDFERMTISRTDGIETMLDVPVDHRIRNLQGSPILENKSFTLPTFLYHLDCSCFCCTNLDYCRLILEVTHLEAIYYLHQSNTYTAAEFFEGCLKIYKAIQTKYESKSITPEIAELFKKELNFTYTELLLDYSLYFAKQKYFDKSLKIIEEIIEISGEDLLKNSYLITEILYHKINYLTAKNNELPDMESSSSENSIEYNLSLSKTPDNKMSVAKFPLSISPRPEPVTKRRVKKELKFDLDSDDEKEKPPESKTKIYKMKTPIKTPAPKGTKIKIYTPSSSSKIKSLGAPLFPKTQTNTKIPTVQKSPIDPESKIKAKKMLEKNTKLLTEKLKAERKGVLKESNKIKTLPETKTNTKKDTKENIRVTRKKIVNKPEETKESRTRGGSVKVSSKISNDKSKTVTTRRQYKGIQTSASISSEDP